MHANTESDRRFQEVSLKTLAVLGDYDGSRVTHKAIDLVLQLLPRDVAATWVPTDSADARSTESFDGLWVAPGTPYRDDAAVISAIQKARTSRQPMLATCGGFQYTVVEFSRDVLGRPDGAHAETDPDASNLVVVPLACTLVGERRMIQPLPQSKLAAICGSKAFSGFHWCNYGISDSVLDALDQAGLRVAAHADDAGVEALELEGHPFFIATLFQPQVEVLDGKGLHPLIEAFVECVQQRSDRPQPVGP